MNNGCICVYDSGIGGLTTMKSILQYLPNENYIYFADDKNCPYGNKNKKEIAKLVQDNIKLLLNKYKIKMLVFACNTITACCVEEVRENFNFEVVGIEPAIKLAMKNSKTKSVLVLLTCATNRQLKYKKLVCETKGEVYSVGLDSLAQDIENYLVNGEKLCLGEVFNKSEEIINNNSNIDSLVLGCTHYIHVKNRLKDRLKINVYDGNTGVAKRVKELLNKKDLFCDENHKNVNILLSSNNKRKIKRYKEILNNMKIIE